MICKKVVISLVFIGTLLVHRPASAEIDFSSPKTMALIVAAAAGTVAAGVLVYNYFFKLSDVEEIARAQDLCNKAQEAYDSIDAAYQPLLSVLNDDALDAKIRAEVATVNAVRPYIAYVASLGKNCSCIETYKNNLSKRKATLMQRSLNLNHNQKLTSEERVTLADKYNETMSIIDHLSELLKDLMRALGIIQKHVTHFPEYEREYMFERIDALEKQVHQLEFSHWCDRIDHYNCNRKQPIVNVYTV